MGASQVELALRARIMELLAQRIERNGGLITRAELTAFDVDGKPLRLIDENKGIWNPRWLDLTLTIVSKPQSIYEDEEDIEGGLLRYRYRKGTIAGDNTKLRAAANSQAPLIFLKWVAKGVYVPVFPVYVVADNPDEGSVLIALDDSMRLLGPEVGNSQDQREYAKRVANARLHQPAFRGRVLVAYGRQCAVCALQRAPLLDAGHIVPDGQPLGQPVTPNGLALCKIHHAAYDQDLIGIDPNYRVHVNEGLLHEVDGPMLKHGLQEMHGRSLIRPQRKADWPDRERLALRFEEFRNAG